MLSADSIFSTFTLQSLLLASNISEKLTNSYIFTSSILLASLASFLRSLRFTFCGKQCFGKCGNSVEARMELFSSFLNDFLLCPGDFLQSLACDLVMGGELADPTELSVWLCWWDCARGIGSPDDDDEELVSVVLVTGVSWSQGWWGRSSSFILSSAFTCNDSKLYRMSRTYAHFLLTCIQCLTRSLHWSEILYLNLSWAVQICSSLSNGMSPHTMSNKSIPSDQTVALSPSYLPCFIHSGGE